MMSLEKRSAIPVRRLKYGKGLDKEEKASYNEPALLLRAVVQ